MGLQDRPLGIRANQVVMQRWDIQLDHEDSMSLTAMVAEATRCYEKGEFACAQDLIVRVLIQKRDEPQHLDLAGRIALQTGDNDVAVQLFSEAANLCSSNPDIYCHLGVALALTGRVDEAIRAQNLAIENVADHVEANYQLGNLACRINRFGDAIGYYEKVLVLAPDHAGAMANLADLLEKRSRIDEAEAILARGLRARPLTPALMLVKARLEKRSGQYREAIARLLHLLDFELPLGLAIEAHYLLGQLYDQEGASERAFQHFREGNELTAKTLVPLQVDKAIYSREVERMKRFLFQDLAFSAGYGSVSGQKKPPVFLIGFPRSGTTLLGQILDSHPRLATLEEKPTIAVVEEAFWAMTGDRENAPGSLTESGIEELRRLYFAAVAEYPESRAGECIVDKMPLNITKIPLIHRIFPEAKFIFAARHPCDACMSCFMQYFAMTNAMAHFLDLEDCVSLYVKVMDIWKRSVSVYPLRFHMIRYEDLVVDFRGETARLLEFLGVEWDDAVLAYHAHARDGENVDTPSYHQVTRPIYREAKYRWKRYERQLAPYMEQLEPYIEFFGYAGADT